MAKRTLDLTPDEVKDFQGQVNEARKHLTGKLNKASDRSEREEIHGHLTQLEIMEAETRAGRHRGWYSDTVKGHLPKSVTTTEKSPSSPKTGATV